MHIVHVSIHVKAEQLEVFKELTIDNARSSTSTEPGCVRFDVVQQVDDPTRFVLVEIYRTPADAAKHKETQHYNNWLLKAESLLAEPRTRAIYTNVFPSDQDLT